MDAAQTQTLRPASDDYLLMKVALIASLAGGCRRDDLAKLQDSCYLVSIPDLKTSAHQTMAPDDHEGFTCEKFVQCIKEIVAISDEIGDGWQLQTKEGLDNAHYLSKKTSQVLEKESGAKMIVVFEYHVAYNINYGVPVLCFVAWKQDGSSLQMEEYCECNKNFSNSDILSTLTQLDHPVLCTPFLTLHPCRTREIMEPFLSRSKNPVVSWMSVISPFLNLSLDEEYIKAC
ncbi:hypothetical protein Zmor_026441 [Zophobas morio]|uniref:Ubiquitin-like-conjugating enzyme ATG10 n=2 Tax=Zophobas morio TaxID=2755281 RepID=A0AA38HVF3_9CUCU|nr:hypothetical protein Zmor_026441 [Zophobas morio]